jgi:hypothetical protein
VLAAHSACKLVDRDGDRKQQGHVLSARDLDAIGVAHADPFLRHRSHDVVVLLHLVLVFEDVALGVEVVGFLDVDLEAITNPDQGLISALSG